MIVTAALAWFDEEPADLERLVRSLPVVADRLVAVDGGYERYPGGAAASPAGQADVIRRAAADAGLDCVIHTPRRVWRGQVEKRTFLLEHAAEGSDWVAITDADYVLHGLRDCVRRELAGLDAEDAVDVDFWTPPNDARPLSVSAATEWHSSLVGVKAKVRGFVRALPGLRVERFHWWYSGVKDGRRVWLWDGDDSYPAADVHTLYAPYFVEHRCMFRGEKQIVRNRLFCGDRDGLVRATGFEDPAEGRLVAA